MKLKKQDFLHRLELADETCSSFANRCKLSRQAVSSWINGERNPKPIHVKVMADALRCGIEDIAEPQTALERNALNGDKFARAILGLDDAPEVMAERSEALDRQFLEYVRRSFTAQVQNGTQTALGKRIGVSAAQINRIAHGKAELGALPISVLSRLCPDAIDHHTVTGEPAPGGVIGTDDPLLRIILEKWQTLSFEDRGRLAGVVSGMGKAETAPPARKILRCPACRAEVPGDWKRGDKYECPKCGQHIELTK